MSNAKLKFAEEIARFLQMFAGLSDYAKEVGAIGSLEQAKAEAEKLALKAQDELKALQDEIAERKTAHKEQCDAVKAEADDYASKRKLEADHELASAKFGAQNIMETAHAQALLITEQAQKERGGLAEELEKAKSSLDAVRGDVNTAKSELEQIKEQISSQRIDLEDVKAKHDAFLKTIGAR